MRAHQALADLAQIRRTIALAERVASYRPPAITLSALFGLCGGVIQAILVPDPCDNFDAYLTIWITVATLSVTVIGCDLCWSCRREESPWRNRLAIQMVLPLLPALVFGAMLSAIIPYRVPQASWMLPGLWSVLLSLGICASLPKLPRLCCWIAGYYFAAGVLTLAVLPPHRSFEVWVMPTLFSTGQFLTALVLKVSESGSSAPNTTIPGRTS